MFLNDLISDGKTQPDPLRFGGKKRIEDLVDDLSRNALTGVGDNGPDKILF